MRLSRQQNKIILDLDADEVATADFIESKWGNIHLKEYIEKHFEQRKQQRDYDNLQDLHRELMNLKNNNDKEELSGDIKVLLNKAKNKPKKD